MTLEECLDVEGRYGFESAKAGSFGLSVGYALNQDGKGTMWSVSGNAGRFEVRAPTIEEAEQAAEDALHGLLVKGLAAFGVKP